MQNYLNNKPCIIKKYMFPSKALYWKKAFITSYSDEVLYFKGVLIEMIAFILKKYTLFMQICFFNYNNLLSKSISLLLKLFIETKPFIISYSNEVLYFKRVLIEINAFILQKCICFCRIVLKLQPFIIKKYIVTTKALY
jgi:hypothetical protein